MPNMHGRVLLKVLRWQGLQIECDQNAKYDIHASYTNNSASTCMPYRLLQSVIRNLAHR